MGAFHKSKEMTPHVLAFDAPVRFSLNRAGTAIIWLNLQVLDNTQGEGMVKIVIVGAPSRRSYNVVIDLDLPSPFRFAEKRSEFHIPPIRLSITGNPY